MTVKPWRLHNALDDAFAAAFTDPNTEITRGDQTLVIEWEPGSDVVGDFTWVNADEVAVTERVGAALLEHFRGFELGPVEMVQDPKLKRPRQLTRRGRRRIWLPYQGPPLRYLLVTAQVSADLERSTLTPQGIHPDYGYMRYQVEGHGHLEWHGRYPDPVETVRVPRQPGKGVYIAAAALEGADIFRVVQLPGWTFCIDAVRQLIIDSQFTNMDFFEMGETF